MPSNYRVHQINEWVAEVTFSEEHGCKALANRKITLNVVAHPKPEVAKSIASKKVNAKVDLRSKFPPVYDQGALGSCVSNAACALLAATSKGVKMYSRLFNYFTARGLEAVAEQSPNYLISDTGLYVDSALLAAVRYGLPTETLWPYNIDNFASLPTPITFIEAYKKRGFSYARVTPTLDGIRAVLNQGYGVMFGFLVYESFFDTGSDGVAPPPSGSILGGHCMVLVGYDDMKRQFIARNSWGADWGDNGHVYLSYDFVTNPDYCFDFYRARAN